MSFKNQGNWLCVKDLLSKPLVYSFIQQIFIEYKNCYHSAIYNSKKIENNLNN